MADASVTKVCTRCSADVAGRPRVKDARGRYMCRPCFDTAAAASAKRASSTRPAVGQTAPDEPVRIAGIHDDAPVAAPASADDNALVFDLAPLAGAPGRGGGPCPTCGHHLGERVRICVNCGFNTATGGVLSTSVGIEKIKGSKEAARDDHLAADSREQHRKAYRVASATLVAGVIGMFVTIATLTDDVEGYAQFYMLTLVMAIAASFLAFLLFALCGAAGGAGFLLILLQVSAVCAAFMPIFVLTTMFPFGARGRWAVRAIVLGGLATWLLDMEEPNNYIFAAVVFFIMVGSMYGSAVLMGAQVL